MAHFAKIDDDNLVLAINCVDNKNVLDENNQEQESLGQQYLQTHNNWPAEKWIQTSYNANFRGHYASVGGTWDSTNNIFGILNHTLLGLKMFLKKMAISSRRFTRFNN